MNAEVIDEISAFYTAHPYPPPVANLDRIRDEWRNPNRRRAEFHLFWPNRSYHTDLKILVTGCGTRQAAKYALCYPDAKVVGIDVSTTSLRETEKLKRKYSLENLYTEQLPIEEVGELGETFDLVICTGVLHHLADPDAGLQALASVLDTDGAIYLMLYAPYGRAGIYMLQDYCRRLGIGTTTKEINDLFSVIKELPPQHPLVSIWQSCRDAQNADALADALLNPRDRAYSVPQLFALLNNSGLSMGRWFLQAPYLPYCGVVAATPHAARLNAMTGEDQFAAMELLRGAMTSHGVIAYHENKMFNIDFDEPFFDKYIPVRLPHTICVTERLPAGAAGVLLNKSHQFHDLILPITAQEKKIFEAIDGSANIVAIVEAAAGENTRKVVVKDFFKKLWYYDQVVFDTSSN